MTASTLRLRTSSGFRTIRMRPLFWVVLLLSTPMKDATLSTAGFLSTTSASACCFWAIAEKEMLCAASDTAWISPVSWVGKKPLGMSMYRKTVSTSVAKATTSVTGWWSSTIRRTRP